MDDDHPTINSMTPLVDDILRHARPILPGEDVIIRAREIHLAREKENIQDELAALRARLLELDHLDKELSASMAKTKSVFSPIHKLPNELLLDIFRHCLPTFHKDSCMNPKDVRFIFAAVCSWWKDVLSDTPTLWSTLVVRGHDQPTPGMNALRKFLALSGEQPLKISFIYRTAGMSEHMDQRVLDLLIEQSHRWRYLSIDDLMSAEYAFKLLTPARIPLLEELYIVGRNFRGHAVGADVITKAPALKKAELPSGYSFPSTLTHAHLTLPDGTGEEFVPEFFASHPHLTECHIFLRDSYSGLTLPGDEEPIAHAALQRLVTDHTSILDCITTPALHTLDLTSTHILLEPSTTDSIVRLVKRSACRLVSLSVAQQPIYDSPALIAELLPLVSETLTTFNLTMEYSVRTDETAVRVLKALTSSSKSAGMLPRMTSFGIKALEIAGGKDFAAVLMEMVRSRCSVELAAQWKAARLLDLGLEVAFNGGLNASTLIFDGGLKELSESCGLALWSRSESKYGFRPSEYPPWVEFAQKKDLSKWKRQNCDCGHCDLSIGLDDHSIMDASEWDSDDSSSSPSFSSSESDWSPSDIQQRHILPFPYPYPAAVSNTFHPTPISTFQNPGFVPYQSRFTPYPAMFAPQQPPPVIPMDTGFPSPSDTSQRGHDHFPLHTQDAFRPPYLDSPPLGPPVIPDFDDDYSDDEEEGDENKMPTFHRTLESLGQDEANLGGIGQLPSDFPYPFNASASMPIGPQDFPYPFNVPAASIQTDSFPLSPLPYPFNAPASMSMPVPNVVLLSPPLGKAASRSGSCRSPPQEGSPGSVLLQADPGSNRQSPMAEVAQRPLSPLQFDALEDLTLEDPPDMNDKTTISSNIGLGLGFASTSNPEDVGLGLGLDHLDSNALLSPLTLS